jgi:hypothetical protein
MTPGSCGVAAITVAATSQVKTPRASVGIVLFMIHLAFLVSYSG